MAEAKPAHSPKPFFTIRDIAERWQCSERQVRRVIQKGDLSAHKFGRLVRISEADLRIYERLNRFG